MFLKRNHKFTIKDDKVIITIYNHNLRLADKNAQQITLDEGPRGSGLELTRTLMDEVKTCWVTPMLFEFDFGEFGIGDFY